MRLSRMSRLVMAVAAAGTISAAAEAADTVKIGFIDPLSGPFAATGTNGLRQTEFAVDTLINADPPLGKKWEVIPYDNQISPKETLLQLKKAIGDGVQYILQGNSSGVANALTEAVDKHNSRNPDQQILYLNYSAVDPALTNEKCNFWHFRFDANADQKMNALSDFIVSQPDIRKIYIIGQDYSFGKAVAAAANSMLKEKSQNIEIVGDELHPIGKVKDFAPYVTKIKDSGADAIITGNWGADMLNLAKSVNQAGLDIPIYTYYAAYDGITAALGAEGKDQIYLIHEGHVNPTPTEELREYHKAFKAKYPEGDLTQGRIINALQMLAEAMKKANSTEPAAVAHALEGMEFTAITGDKLTMRADDHQLIQPIQISVHTDEDIEFDGDNSGYGLKTVTSIKAEDTVLPTTCQMNRPS